MKHRNKNSIADNGNNEWLTPPHIVDMVREVLGEIDCDPASCNAAQEYIQAKTYYTIETNGLDHSWLGRVFLNPPYQRGLIDRFISHLVSDAAVTQYITLTNNATATKWCQMLLLHSDVVCFPKKRIRFISLNDDKGGLCKDKLCVIREKICHTLQKSLGIWVSYCGMRIGMR